MSITQHGSRALLIQDFREAIQILNKVLDEVQHTFYWPSLNRKAMIEWYVSEELERNFYFVVNHHNYKLEPYRTVYVHLQNRLGNTAFSSTFIKAPKLYGDFAHVKVEIRDSDLFIWYPK